MPVPARRRCALHAVGLPRKLLEDLGLFIGSHVLSIGSAEVKNVAELNGKMSQYLSKGNAWSIGDAADKSEVRILDKATEAKAISAIKACKKKGDTLGGIFEVIVSGVPIGLGSYVHYDRKLDGKLAEAVMSIHAVKGVEIGDRCEYPPGFGSEVHDELLSG